MVIETTIQPMCLGLHNYLRLRQMIYTDNQIIQSLLGLRWSLLDTFGLNIY